MEQANEPKVSIVNAARAVRKRFTFVKKLVDDGEVPAWEGGSEKCRRLQVYVRDVRAAIDRVTRYVPPKRRRRASTPSTDLHPSVRC